MTIEQSEKQVKEIVENNLQLEEVKLTPTFNPDPELIKKFVSRAFLKKSKHSVSRAEAAKSRINKRKVKRKN